MSEPEPRRSVRTTKGQHKSLDQLDQAAPAAPNEPKKRGRKPTKKTKEKSEEPEDEIIRCVCGATEQDEVDGEQWISCDKCRVWQHNVCLGLSLRTEDLPKEYFCELCKPKDHADLVAAIARGEKPWEAHRKAYEEAEQAKAGKGRKKKGPKGTKQKRASDVKDDASTTKGSPAPESKKEKEPKAAAGTKRKSRAPSEDKADTKAGQKLRKLSETQAAPVRKTYDPPADIAATIADLPDARQALTKALVKSITHALAALEKKNVSLPDDGVPAEKRPERLALQIERAVQDTHATQKECGQQLKLLQFNLKANPDLCARLLEHTLVPPDLAVMTSDDLASKELQKETAEMKARAEKQSILITDEVGPRVRRTHKGEEMIEGDSFTVSKEERPSALRRQSVREGQEARDDNAEDTTMGESAVELPAELDIRQGSSSQQGLQIDTQQAQQSPKTDFDLNKVFSSVRSPSLSQNRRPSQPAPVSTGPGVDADVDRLLQDDRDDSPPYSPSEETDPNVVWRGHVSMSTVADFQATAKHVGGADISKTVKVPWTKLIPRSLTIAGRIAPQKATEYLCSLRYSPLTDVIVTSISPAHEGATENFTKLYDYFASKQRFAVVGDKGVGNVRDTYLIPVPAGTGNVPEFMLNLEDNFLPESRDQPLLLAVFVYRNEPAQLDKIHGPGWSQQATPQSPMTGTPTPSATTAFSQRHPSVSGPAFSPTSPQGAVFPNAQIPRNSATPQPGPGAQAYQNSPTPPGQAVSQPPQSGPTMNADAARKNAQIHGEAMAKQILGPYISCPTVNFLLPQAHEMVAKEWQLIFSIYESEPKAREDLQFLSEQIEKRGSRQQSPNNSQGASQASGQAQGQGRGQAGAANQPPAPPKMSQTPVPIPHIPHSNPSPAVRPPPAQQQQPQPGGAAAPVPQHAAPPPA